MKVTIKSTFHEIGATFVGLKEGENLRKVKRVCGKECQCGYPYLHTEVTESPEEYEVTIEHCFYKGYDKYTVIRLDKKTNWKPQK